VKQLVVLLSSQSSAARLALLVPFAERDLPRVSNEWVYNAAALFHQHPRLGLVGMAPATSSSADGPGGFAFTADSGPGPWLVRRDALIEVR
jgi:hypothetical protein